MRRICCSLLALATTGNVIAACGSSGHGGTAHLSIGGLESNVGHGPGSGTGLTGSGGASDLTGTDCHSLFPKNVAAMLISNPEIGRDDSSRTDQARQIYDLDSLCQWQSADEAYIAELTMKAESRSDFQVGYENARTMADPGMGQERAVRSVAAVADLGVPAYLEHENTGANGLVLSWYSGSTELALTLVAPDHGLPSDSEFIEVAKRIEASAERS
jgi:hypothetical protein